MESYNWSVSNGEIITGNGTSEISVKWDIGQTGIVSLMASSNECSTATIDYNVNIELPQNSDEFSFSVARLWNEVLLFSIRNDLARPTVRKNLFHTRLPCMMLVYRQPTGLPYLIGNINNGFELLIFF